MAKKVVINVTLKIEKCWDCPLCSSKAGGDLYGDCYSYYCTAKTRKLIAKDVVCASQMVDVPSWCPCLVDKAANITEKKSNVKTTDPKTTNEKDTMLEAILDEAGGNLYNGS